MLRQTFRFVMRKAYQFMAAVGRHVVPKRIKGRLIDVVRRVDNIVAQVEFRDRTPLREIPPLLPATTFADGPIIHCNNALAAGGVERQIVNTLRGLSPHFERLGLLCVRLGLDTEHSFFRKDLADFGGFVRNAMPFREARKTLAGLCGAEARARLGQTIAWLPSDVGEEVIRFAAEFIMLKPSVVHAWQDSVSISAGYAARLAGVPKIVISSRNMAPIHFGYFRPYMRAAYLDLSRCSQVVMLNNSEAGACDYASWLGISVGRYRILRNGIDTAAVRRPTSHERTGLRASLGIPEHAPVVGGIFRFYEEKQPLLWITAAAIIARIHRACHFVIFGTGPMEADVLKFARECGFDDRLHCPGTIQDVPLGLSLFDVFVLTSKFEGTPNVVLEASLMGIPIVATDAGGTRETILQGETGLVVEFGDPEEIARCVDRILTDPSWARRARQKGPEFVQSRFGLERMLHETMNLYRC